MDYYELMDEIKKIEQKKEEIGSRYTEELRKTSVLSPDTIIDEEKSVRWNREEVARRNNSRKGKLAYFTGELNKCSREIGEKIIEHLQSEFGFTEAVARIVFDAAYESGHHAGASEVVSYARDYASMVERVLDAMDKS